MNVGPLVFCASGRGRVMTVFHGRERYLYLMKQSLAQIALVVRDYDEAIRFYCDVLQFRLLEDTPMSPTKRWVRVAPPGSEGCGLLLAKAVGPEQESRIGNQAGGRVFLFLHTDNFDRDYARLLAHEVRIIREPSVEAYGKVAVFADLYGNLWDLVQPAKVGTA